MDWSGRVELFATTANGCADVVERIPDPEAPALGVWTCAQLSAHVVRAITTLQTYAAGRTTTTPTLPDAAAYVATYVAERNADPAAMDRAVAQRTIDDAASSDLDSVVADLRAGAGWARTHLIAMNPAGTVPTRFGSLPLHEYLRTRMLELVVHGLDLATATGIPFSPPVAAMTDALGVLTGAAILTGDAPEVIRALTGRTAPAPVVIR